jgi:nucleoid DNA-binding protein
MERLTKRLSEKYNIPEYHIKAIIETPFRLLSEEMENRTLKGIQLKGLGKICIGTKRKQWIIDNILEKVKKRDEQAKSDK